MDIKATGIDISKFQTIDWDALESAFKAGKLRFIIMRAGYGYTTIDPKFEDNYAQATKRGKNGNAAYIGASCSRGVRPAFCIKF